MSINGNTIAVVIPALNEEQSIGRVLKAMPAEIDVVVVCDNGSTDRTAKVAAECGAVVVYEPKRGYGAACLRALAELGHNPPEIVAFIDADFSDDPLELLKVIHPVAHSESELCIGSRNTGLADAGSLTPVQRFGNWLSTGLIDLFWGVRFTDLGPMRAITWDTLQQIGMRDTTFGWTVEMQLKAAKLKAPCTEVPVHYRNRIGVSKVSGTVKGSIKAGSKILYTIAAQSGYQIAACLSTLGIVIGALLVASAPANSNTHAAVVFSISASALWLLLAYSIFKLNGIQAKLTRMLVVAGVVGHIALAPSIGLLTDDQYRYEWDGRLMVAGASPYSVVPVSDSLQSFRGASILYSKVVLPDQLPFATVKTIYPPAAQSWFQVQQYSHRLFSPLLGGVTAWKLPTLFAIAMSLVLGALLLKKSALSSSYILPVLLSPLLLIHGTADAHIDVAMVMFGIAAVLSLRTPIGSGLLWGWAALMKFIPLLFLPILAWQFRGANRFVVVLLVLMTVATGYVVLAPTATQGSLSMFIASWESNGAFFRLLKVFASDDVARMLVGGVFAILSVTSFAVVKNKIHAAVFIMMFMGVMSPVLHPWYLLPLLFTLPFFPLRSAWLLCATITLSGVFYLGYKNSGMWVEHPAIVAIEFIPVVWLLVADVFQYLRKQKANLINV